MLICHVAGLHTFTKMANLAFMSPYLVSGLRQKLLVLLPFKLLYLQNFNWRYIFVYLLFITDSCKKTLKITQRINNRQIHIPKSRANQSCVDSPSILTDAGSDELLLRLYCNSNKVLKATFLEIHIKPQNGHRYLILVNCKCTI